MASLFLQVTCHGELHDLGEPEQFESGAGREWLEHHFDDGGRKWWDDQPERVRYSERGQRRRHSDVHQCRHQRDAERECRQRSGWRLHADGNGYRGVSDPHDHGAAHRDGAEQVDDHFGGRRRLFRRRRRRPFVIANYGDGAPPSKAPGVRRSSVTAAGYEALGANPWARGRLRGALVALRVRHLGRSAEQRTALHPGVEPERFSVRFPMAGGRVDSESGLTC